MVHVIRNEVVMAVSLAVNVNEGLMLSAAVHYYEADPQVCFI